MRGEALCVYTSLIPCVLHLLDVVLLHLLLLTGSPLLSLLERGRVMLLYNTVVVLRFLDVLPLGDRVAGSSYPCSDRSRHVWVAVDEVGSRCWGSRVRIYFVGVTHPCSTSSQMYVGTSR